MDQIKSLVRKSVQTFSPYLSARRLGGQASVWVNANESPNSTEYQLTSNIFNRYPEGQPAELIGAYARYAGIDPSKVVVTRGADEAIELVMQVFCEPGQDRIAFCSPTYGMYRVNADKYGIAVNELTLNEDWTFNITELEKQLTDVKLVFICNPNNPVGTLTALENIEKLLQITAGKAMVVVDEAYIDFTMENSAINLLKKYPNLIILRTLSKAFALAGLRCGFILTSEEVVSQVLKIIAPYPIAQPVADIAIQALTDEGVQWMQQNVQAILSARDQFVRELKQSAWVDFVCETAANFVLVRFKEKDRIFHYLSDLGILVRPQAGHSMLEDCVRITIGTESECQKLIDALKTFQ